MKKTLLAGWVSVSMLSLGALAVAGEKEGVKPAATQSGAAPDSKMEIERQKIKTDKKFVVSENMDLTDAEAKSFWPLYDAYQKELDKLNQRMAKLITTYIDASENDKLTNELARKSVAEYLDIESAELEAKRAMLSKVGKVLPAQKVARYAQVENKIRALVKYELAINIPLGA
jgi:hypothetical protein